MKIIGQILLFFLVVNMTWGQEHDVVLPSPETAALFRYQDYPMDHSTGLPQISIPLFTVQNRSLSVPISLSYHASGFKVADRDGPIAAGWSLNVGGMVSRTINGDPDFGDHKFPAPFETILSDQSDLATLERIMHYESPWSSFGQWLDSEYDIFSYNLPGQSGKFLFKDENGVKTPVLFPSKPLVINHNAVGGAGLQTINITDDKGDVYTFSGTETSGSDYTGFTLNNIVSANLKDVINYTYTSTPQERKTYYQNIVVNDKWGFLPGSANPEAGGTLEINLIDFEQRDQYFVSRISEIDFEQGKVEFVLKGGSGEDKDLINSIDIRDRNSNLIRRILFKRSPLHTIAVQGFFSTHKLTAIEIQDINSNTVESYSFEYNPTKYSGVNDGGGVVNPRYIDFWGYYNASGQPEMIYHPDIYVQPVDGWSLTEQIPIGNNDADREPDLLAASSGVLRKVFYPTGGHSEFVYEQNRYYNFDEGQDKAGPGLRVQQIITSDGDGNTFDRTFTYGTDESEQSAESGYGFIDLEPKLDRMKTTILYEYYPPGLPESKNTHRERIFYSGFVPSLGELASRPVIYTSVTEYKGDKLNNEGKTVYNYDNPQWGGGVLGSPGSEGILKWHIPKYNFWDMPMLQHQTDYKAIKDANNVVQGYNEIRKISNQYTAASSPANDIYGLHVQRRYSMPQGLLGTYESPTIPEPFGEAVGALYFQRGVYAHAPYRIPVGNKNLTSTTETLTNDDGTIVSTNTSYVYNAQNFVSEINTTSSRIDGTNSQSSILKKELFYTADSNDAPFGLMANRNMLQYKVEEKNSFDGQLTNTSKINYKDWGNTIFKPEFIEIAKGNDASERRTNIHSYDSKGNPQETSQENGPHIYYIWGYHDTQPIAKIDNFTQAQATTIQGLINTAKTASDNDDGTAGKESLLRTALKNIRDHSALDNSFITTYTYDPLVGATSMTDPRGYTIFYEYDAFNRLKVVRDDKNQIVSDYEYSYKQPTN